MSVEFFMVCQDGEERGRGVITSIDGTGVMFLNGQSYNIRKLDDGNHERLPEQGPDEEETSYWSGRRPF